jgi:SAM-dependent methyltransferase
MRRDDLSIFRSPLVPDEDIRFEGECNGDEVADGLLCAGNSVVGYVEDGVPSLTAPLAPPDSDNIRKWLDGIRSRDGISKGWDSWSRKRSEAPEGPLKLYRDEFPRRLSEVDGLVLEIGAGPGGGLAPGIVLANQDARVLLNDISIGILQLQREYLTRARIGPNVILAAWDATDRVLRPETVAAVSSAGGFSNINSWDPAVRAAFEALVPGGQVFMAEIARGTEEIAALPEWIREGYDLEGSWLDDLEEIGFQVENHETLQGELMTDPDDSGLAKDVIENGLTMHRAWDYIAARKPK